MRRHDPAGNILPPDAYVFGDELGRRIKSMQKAWSTLRLKMIGHGPHWVSNNKLAHCCREALAKLNLHFHDLRREGGSRLLEGGLEPHIVQQCLDRANLSTTSRYLKVTRQAMHAAMKRYEAARNVKNDTFQSEVVATEMAERGTKRADETLSVISSPSEILPNEEVAGVVQR